MQVILRTVCAFLLLVILTESKAQLTINQFLSTANQDEDLKSIQDQLTYLEGKPYRLSPFQKFEFRTKNNQLDPDRQDFALRLNPANPWEMKNTTNYYKEYQNSLSIERQLVLKKSLKSRYLKVIEYCNQQELVDIKKQSIKYLDAQATILDRQSVSDNFDSEDIVKIKLDQLDLLVEMDELSFDLIKKQKEIQRIGQVSTPLSWTSLELITVEQIKHIADSISTNISTASEVIFSQTKVDLVAREYSLEKSNINVGFLQTEYESYRTEQDRKPWSISLGVTIPITNPNKGDMTKRKLEMIDAQHDLEESKVEVQNEIGASRDELGALIRRYEELDAKIQSLNTGSLSSLLITLKNNNPMALIRFNNNLLKLKTLQLRLKQNILVAYIELLESTDMLQQSPLVNYLSQNLTTIER